MAGRLRGMKEAFESLDDNTEDFSPIDKTGDERVSARLLEFGRNWFDRRAEMAGLMSDLADLAEDAAEAYQATDRGATPRRSGGG